MKILCNKFPVDIVLCMVWSAILFPIAVFNMEAPIRIILGAPFILFIPGYVLVSALFPSKKPGSGITVIERIVLSFGVSIAIVPLVGLGLNFSPWGIRLEPMLLALSLFIFSVGSFALYRWFATTSEERFSISIDVSFPTFENRFDKALTIILAALIITSVALLLYVIIAPKVGEKFTEFYVLGPNGEADNYPQNLSVGQNATVLIGISNHEYREINYTVEVWLINQTTYYNITENKNKTFIDHMWFVNEITVELNHIPMDIDTPGKPQWEYNYSFSLHQVGSFKLAFLLYTTPTKDYTPNEDYNDTADQVLNSAYRDVHLWVTVT